MSTTTQTAPPLRILAAVVDEAQLLLYKDDGSTITILQGDPRLAKIVSFVTPLIIANGVAELPSDMVILKDTAADDFREVEKQSNGLVRFFRVARSFFSKKEEEQPPVVEPMAIGQVPAPMSPFTDVQAHHLTKVVEDLVARATASASADFRVQGTGRDSDDTIVAVVDNQVIPNIEALTSQIARASNLSHYKGFFAFLGRLAAIHGQREHSVDDLLKFLERGDLPIADDGSIIIYKILKNGYGANEGRWVDCHTGKVPQRVGSYVCMDPSMVDHDRGQDCSHGLHVARREYLNGFAGDVMVMAKVAPEDVIAVPLYDANKMRVSGYHIIGQITADDDRRLRSNRPIADEETKQLLARAISGDHDAPIERVEITESYGGGVKVTPLVEVTEAGAAVAEVPPRRYPPDDWEEGDEDEWEDDEAHDEAEREAEDALSEEVPPPTPVQAVVTAVAEALPIIDLTQENQLTAPALDPKNLSTEVAEQKQAAHKSRADIMQELVETFNRGTNNEDRLEYARAAYAYKRKVKQSWAALDVTWQDENNIEAVLREAGDIK